MQFVLFSPNIGVHVLVHLCIPIIPLRRLIRVLLIELLIFWRPDQHHSSSTVLHIFFVYKLQGYIPIIAVV